MYNKIAGLQHIKCIKESLSRLIFNSVSLSRKAYYALWSDKWLFRLIRCWIWNFWNVMAFSSNPFAVRLSVAGAFYMIINSEEWEYCLLVLKKLWRTSQTNRAIIHISYDISTFEACDVIISHSQERRFRWRRTKLRGKSQNKSSLALTVPNDTRIKMLLK